MRVRVVEAIGGEMKCILGKGKQFSSNAQFRSLQRNEEI